MQLQSYKSLRKITFKKGYTLVELLVGITIISIVFSIGYASFREFSRRQALSGVSKKIKADLRLAQQLSLTGQKPDACTQLDGYTVSFLATSYTLTANCIVSGVNRDIITKTVDLDTDVTQNNLTVKYKILGQGTSLDNDITLTLTHTPTGNTSAIIIGKGGDVN